MSVVVKDNSSSHSCRSCESRSCGICCRSNDSSSSLTIFFIMIVVVSVSGFLSVLPAKTCSTAGLASTLCTIT